MKPETFMEISESFGFGIYKSKLHPKPETISKTPNQF
jgi:hypothetical protein